MGASGFVVVPGLPGIHTTPLARVVIEDSNAILELDDLDERRIRLIFRPYQAVQITTADCFEPPSGGSVLPNTVLEVRQSPWIRRLTEQQKRIDETASFMEKARHFLVPLQEDFFEVVAWDVNWKVVDPLHEDPDRPAKAK